MGLRFVLGRAGSGKTRHCLDAIYQELQRNPSPAAPPLFWLLPEQATAQAERSLLELPGLQAIFRARVLSFKKLGHWVMEDSPNARKERLGDLGKRILLRSLLTEHQEKLRFFKQTYRERGMVERLARSLHELAQGRQSLEKVRAYRADLDDSEELACKLDDLLLLGKAFHQRIQNRFQDPDRFLEQLAVELDKSSLFRGSRVWVDGFAHFTGQELHVLGKIIEQADHVDVALLMEPQSRHGLPESHRDLEKLDLFLQTEETYLRLRALCRDNHFSLEESLELPLPNQPTRFSPFPQWQAFEEGLFQSKMFTRKLEASLPDAQPGLPERLPPLCLVEAEEPWTEVEGAIRQMEKLCREEGLRYRDVAFLARSLDSYEPIIRSLFARYGVPYFIDRKRPMAHHPLVETLRSALKAVLTDWLAAETRPYLKTDFLPVERLTADAIENRSLENGFHLRSQWMGKEEKDPEQKKAQARAFAPLDQLHQALTEQKEAMTGAVFTGALCHFLETLKTAETMEKWTLEAREGNNMDRAGEHEQVWTAVQALLEEMEGALPDAVFPLQEWVNLLESGLEGLSLGLVPPCLDQVLVGEVERSRQPDLKAVFFLGLNEKIFPAVVDNHSLFTDEEREAINREGRLELDPDSNLRLFQERLLAYVAFTRGAPWQWVSHSRMAPGGKAASPSLFWKTVLEEGAKINHFLEWRKLDRAHLEKPSHWNRKEQAIEALLSAGGGHLEKCLPREIGEQARQVREKLTPLSFQLPVESWRDRISPKRVFSISQLETWAKCPFLYFGNYGLRLSDRGCLEITPLELGSLQHDLLFMAYQALSKKWPLPSAANWPDWAAGVDWKKGTEAELEELLEKAVAGEVDGKLAGHEKSRRNLMKERLLQELQPILEQMMRMGQEEAFTQVAGELSFGGEGKLPALKIQHGDQTALKLQGRIDRLDAATVGENNWVRVVDYKSSDKNTCACWKVLEGLELQLLIYLKAAELLGEKKWEGGGAFYFPVNRKPAAADLPPEEAENQTNQKLRGILPEEAEAAYPHLEPGEKSPYYKMGRKQDGNIRDAKRSDWQERGTLEKAGLSACMKAESLFQEILSGLVTPAPHQEAKPCTYCAYNSFCRFDPQRDKKRKPQADKTTTWDKLDPPEVEGWEISLASTPEKPN